MRPLISCCLAIALASGIAAVEAAEGQTRAPFTPGPPVTLPECMCRAKGQEWRLGETICLQTATGERLATCTMDLNVTSWRISDVPCATSSMGFRVMACLTQRNFR
jgi:hypothetical protein